jgi:Fission yeast centromere protein N-terminal domain
MGPRQDTTIEQRRALRRWAHRQYPKPTQKYCIEWFLPEYNHKLSQSTVSESLSAHFSHLDNYANSESQRLREGY